MRELINDFVRVCAATLPFAEPIYEFGAYQVPGQEEIAELRPLFPGMRYVGSDMRPGRGVDCILNLHELGLPDACVGAALMLDTLEHVEYPHRACAEVFRVLRPGGVVVMSSVMNFPIHGFPDDYWRFTPSAFQSLLKPFAWSLVETVGREDFPHTVVGVGCKGQLPAAAAQALEREMARWKERWTDAEPGPAVVMARRLVPPILLDLTRRARGIRVE